MSHGKAKQQYHNHKHRAKRKGIGFEMTFDEWYNIWINSGHYHEKGTKRGQYVMSRYNDIGPYKVGNVYIQTVGENTKEAFTTNNKDFIKPRYGIENHFYGKKHSDESIQKIRDARKKQQWSDEINKKRRAEAGSSWGQ